MASSLPFYIVFVVTSEDYTLVMRTTVLFWNRRTMSVYCDDNKPGQTCSTASLLSDSRRLIVFHIVKACFGQPESSRDVASADGACALDPTESPGLTRSFLSSAFPTRMLMPTGVVAVTYRHRSPTITFLPLRVLTRSSSYWTTRVMGVGITACCRSARRVISRTRGFRRSQGFSAFSSSCGNICRHIFHTG